MLYEGSSEARFQFATSMYRDQHGRIDKNVTPHKGLWILFLFVAREGRISLSEIQEMPLPRLETTARIIQEWLKHADPED